MLLGIDIGSSAVKAALVDPDEGVLSSAQVGVDLIVRHPGWAEADPDQWWRAICELVPALLRQSGRGAEEIEAVASAGMVPAVLTLDGQGQPLRNAILQNDARATREIEELAQALSGVDLLSLTGSALTQQSVAPTLRWLRRHEPDLFGHTETIVGSYDWIAQRMGAKAHIEQNWAIESGLFSLDGAQLQEVLDSTETSAQLLPEMRRSGAIVGEVSASAASETGLRAGTPIVVGGADHVSSAYGAGLLSAGDWIVKLGGAGDIGIVCERRWSTSASTSTHIQPAHGC
jgi:xylulokinase